MRAAVFFQILFLCYSQFYAQERNYSEPVKKIESIATGRVYGKVLDDKTGKPLEFSPVQLMQVKWDSISKTSVNVFVGGQLSEENGDFSIENVPVSGKFLLKISAIGYDPIEQPVNLNASRGILDKDLGNFRLKELSQQLNEVIIDGSEPSYKLEIDKKVYNVSKNPITSGGTAEDVLKNVPSVSVDMDGNVTMRNASPQVFVDGRPTTLTIHRIS